ncbi:MAG: hypothetical protein E8G75_08910, partial [Sulfitobacter sp. SK025]
MLLLVLVGGAIAGGLLVVGGPGRARAERQDAARLADLRSLHTYLSCPGRSKRPLPRALDDAEYCPGPSGGIAGAPHLRDPVSGQAYAYTRLDDHRFEVCATVAVDPARHAKGSVKKRAWSGMARISFVCPATTGRTGVDPPGKAPG